MGTKTFTLYWLDGKSETIEGRDFSNAMTKAGYGNGALKALDFFTDGDSREIYEWDGENRRWKSIDFFKVHGF
ncbi:MAG: hypothetical protein GX163_04345 [Bacteroidetes bacterium]|jgi:hypothetical protein|nr:hypothetical protein [Bacteroidota bacterium]